MVAKFVDMLINNEILDEPCREQYIYALTLRMEQMLTYSILLVIAIITQKVIIGMIYAFSFVFLRKTTGGFHARTFAGCLIGTSALFIFTLEIIAPLLGEHIFVESLLLLCSVICVIKFAPVNHPNLALTLEEKSNHRKWSRFILGLELVFVFIGMFLGMDWQQYIILGIITCAVFIIIAKFIGQEVSDDEKGKQER